MFASLKERLWEGLVRPELARRGWRRSLCSPTDETSLLARFGFDEEEAIKRAVGQVRGNTMMSFERLASLWQQVRYLDRYGIEGAFVECGVWRGGAVGMMALAHRQAPGSPRRHLHLFDSFEGLPEPRADVDGREAADYARQQAGGQLRPIRECVGPLDDNRQLLERDLGYPASLLHYHVGWFEKTVPADADGLGPIALLRLDGDWYESTKICLDHLCARVVRGGVIIIDDYGHWEGCKRAVDEFLAASGEPALLGHIDYTARYWVKQLSGGPPGRASSGPSPRGRRGRRGAWPGR